MANQFVIVFAFKSKGNISSNKIQGKYIYKSVINESSIEPFKSSLYKMSWENIKNLKNQNDAYDSFLDTKSILYKQSFPKLKFKTNSKRTQNLKLQRTFQNL